MELDSTTPYFSKPYSGNPANDDSTASSTLPTSAKITFSLKNVEFNEYRRIKLAFKAVPALFLGLGILTYTANRALITAVSTLALSFFAKKPSAEFIHKLNELKSRLEAYPSKEKGFFTSDELTSFYTPQLSVTELHSLKSLYCLLDAFDTCAKLDKSTEELNAKKQQIINELTKVTINIKSGQRAISTIRQILIECLIDPTSLENKKNIKENFNKQYYYSLGFFTGSYQNSFEIDGLAITEQTVPLSNEIGLEYSNLRKDIHSSLNVNWETTLRISALKSDPSGQNLLINGHQHTISVEDAHSTILRSGAFAVHSRKAQRLALLKDQLKACPTDLALKANLETQLKLLKNSRVGGIHTLTNLANAQPTLDNKILHRWGFEDLEALKLELSERRDFTLAQSLPKIVQSLENLVKDPSALEMAEKTRKFLHVEEGLLSHLHQADQLIIDDMKGTMDYLRNHCKIKLTDEKTSIQVDSTDRLNPELILFIQKPKKCKIENSPTFGLEALYFNTGVNELQTLGQLFKPNDDFQAKINAEGLTQLELYYESVIEKSEELSKEDPLKTSWQAIRHHYSPATTRQARDIAGLKLRHRLVKTLKGGRGVVCKSGKDRTGMEISRALASEIAEEKCLPERKIRIELQKGISYHLTSLNTGQPAAYAFYPFFVPFLPNELQPPLNLCAACET